MIQSPNKIYRPTENGFDPASLPPDRLKAEFFIPRAADICRPIHPWKRTAKMPLI
jgi:hypothetical protein